MNEGAPGPSIKEAPGLGLEEIPFRLDEPKTEEYEFTKLKRTNNKHFLPLSPDFKHLFNSVINDEELLNKIYWTKSSVFGPDFIIERIKKAPKKKWNWWWICKNLPLNYLLDLTLIDGVVMDMNGVSANTNLTIEFYQKFDNWKWKHQFLCANSALLPQEIVAVGIEIDGHYLSKNPRLTRKFVDDNPDIVWNIRFLTTNPGTKDDIFKNPPPNFICYINYSKNKEVTPEFYTAHPGCFFNWNQLSVRFPFEFIKNIIDKDPMCRFGNCWPYISMNPDVTMETVRKYPEYPWCYRTLCLNPSIDPEDMKKHEIEFLPKLVEMIKEFGSEEWDELLKKEINDIEIIKDYMRIRYGHKKYRVENTIKYEEDAKYLMSIIKNGVNWYNLSHNPKTTFGFILENANKSFDWKYLSHIADPKTIKDYPSVLWDMDEFSEFADVDLEYVKANEDICWSWRGLSKNKNFSWKTIEANKDKSWYWHIVFSMKSYNNRESVIEELGDDEPIKV